MITLFLLANHEPQKWSWQGEEFDLGPGQLVTSLRSMAEKAGVSIQNVRSAIRRFEKMKILTNHPTTHGRTITLINWDSYQAEGTSGNMVANKGATKPQQLTRRKESEKKEPFTHEDRFEEIWALYPRKQGKAEAGRHFAKTVKDETSWQEIRTALDHYLKDLQRRNLIAEDGTVINGQFILAGRKWFGEWREWLEAARHENQPPPKQLRLYDTPLPTYLTQGD